MHVDMLLKTFLYISPATFCKRNTLLLVNCHLYFRGITSKNRGCDTQSNESGNIFQLDVSESEDTQKTSLSRPKLLIPQEVLVYSLATRDS